MRWCTLLLPALSACVHVPPPVTADLNTDRIDDAMRAEAFSDETPGAAGIALGPDAPPLSVPPADAPGEPGDHPTRPTLDPDPPGVRVGPYRGIAFIPVPTGPACPPGRPKAVVKVPPGPTMVR